MPNFDQPFSRWIAHQYGDRYVPEPLVRICATSMEVHSAGVANGDSTILPFQTKEGRFRPLGLMLASREFFSYYTVVNNEPEPVLIIGAFVGATNQLEHDGDISILRDSTIDVSWSDFGTDDGLRITVRNISSVTVHIFATVLGHRI